MRKFNVDVRFTYNNKIENRLCRNKPRDGSLDGFGVYKIPCRDCEKVYIGESGRDLKVRMKEHMKDIENMKEESAVANHVKESNHFFDFENAEIMVPCTDRRKRRIIESSIIKSQLDKAVNLNHGFSPYNAIITSYIADAVNLQETIT